MNEAPRAIAPGDVVDAVNEVLGAVRAEFAPVTAGTSLEEVALSSVDFVEVLMRLEEVAGCELDPASLDAPRVVGDLAAIQPWSGRR